MKRVDINAANIVSSLHMVGFPQTAWRVGHTTRAGMGEAEAYAPAQALRTAVKKGEGERVARVLRRGGAILGAGQSGQVHYGKDAQSLAALGQRCYDEWVDGTVAKVMSTEEAEAELEQANQIRARINNPEILDYLILPTKLCNINAENSVLFSKYGGKSILSIVHKGGNPIETSAEAEHIRDSMHLVPPRIDPDLKANLTAALKNLKAIAKQMNRLFVYHGDVVEMNVVFDGETTRLIDFEHASVGFIRRMADDVEVQNIIDNLDHTTTGGRRRKTRRSRRKTGGRRRKTRRKPF
jgi:hypothetical protein